MQKMTMLVMLLVCLLRIDTGAQAQHNPDGSSLAASLGTAIAELCPTTCIPVDTAGLGNFFWFYQNINGVFNQATLDMIDTRVMPGTVAGVARLSAAGGFPNAYAQVVARLVYTLGSADQRRVQQTMQASAVAAASTVAAAEAAFGPITPAALEQARKTCGRIAIEARLDYVITYLMGSVWSGRGAQGLSPLTTEAMTAAPDLLHLLPFTPAAGHAVVAAAGAYLQAAQAISALWAQVQLASWQIHRLSENTGSPTSANGGMATVSPWTGFIAPGAQPGYRIARTLMDISTELNDPARVLRVTMRTPDTAGQLRDYVLEVSGYTYIPIVPNALQDSGTGWYASAPIAAAAANGTRDVTGYKFVGAPGYNMQGLADGGNFGRLTGLLVCQDIRVLPTAYPPPARGAAVFAHVWNALSAPRRSTAPGTPILEQQAYVIAATVAFPP